MTGSAVVLIIVLSLSIFAVRGNFGEALLSLVGGLLAVFAQEWTPERYIAFSVGWIGFALLAFLIASIKLAAKAEVLFKQAALKLVGAGDQLVATEKLLREIAGEGKLSTIGPTEKAEIIRDFSFRGLPLRSFSSALKATERLSIITRCDIGRVVIFVADFFNTYDPEDELEAEKLTDRLYESIQLTPVPPEEFFLAFERSRRLIVSGSTDPDDFLSALSSCLSDAVPIDDLCHEIELRGN